jgi:hypothetical protein
MANLVVLDLVECCEMAEFSVVTVASGSHSGLLDTIASVDQQSLKPRKHILVLSRVPLEQLALIPGAAYRSLVVDKDTSLYDAMNIGMSMVKGDLLLFLNGGDTLYRSGTLHAVSKKWDGTSIVSGRSLQVYSGDTYVRPAVGRLNELLWSAPHQSFFCPISRGLPAYDNSGRIGADSQWMSLVRKQFRTQLINDIVCRFELGGLSNAPTLRSVRRRAVHEGVVSAVKEFGKLSLHQIVGRRCAYRILFKRRYGLCAERPERAYKFPVV